MLSVDVAEEPIHKAMEAGAYGYLSKSTPPEELLHAIREAAAGRRFLPAELDAKLQRRRQREELTPRELACCARS